jgi:hypothetical protein
VFTKPLLRKGLHNSVVPLLLGVDDIENTASSIVACWTVSTELLPGNELIKSVTICIFVQKLCMVLLTTCCSFSGIVTLTANFIVAGPVEVGDLKSPVPR